MVSKSRVQKSHIVRKENHIYICAHLPTKFIHVTLQNTQHIKWLILSGNKPVPDVLLVKIKKPKYTELYCIKHVI